MTLQDSDKFLLNRTGNSFHLEAQNLMAELKDDDLMLVNRQVDGVQRSYKVTGEEVKDSLGGGGSPPFITGVSLTEQDPESADRFTSQKFDVGVTNNAASSQPLSYFLKAKVTGDLVTTVTTSEITGVAGNVLTFADDKDLALLQSGDFIKQDNASGVFKYSDGLQTPSTWAQGPALGFDGVLTGGNYAATNSGLWTWDSSGFDINLNSSGTTLEVIVYLNCSSISSPGNMTVNGLDTGVPVNIGGPATKDLSAFCQAQGITKIDSISMTPPTTGETFSTWLFGIKVNGVTLIDGTGLMPSGTVSSRDPIAKTITLATNNSGDGSPKWSNLCTTSASVVNDFAGLPSMFDGDPNTYGGIYPGTLDIAGFNSNGFDIAGNSIVFKVVAADAATWEIKVNGTSIATGSGSQDNVSGSISGGSLTSIQLINTASDPSAGANFATITVGGTLLTDGTGFAWSVGNYVIGPTTSQSNATQYCIFDTDGNIETLQSADPGYKELLSGGTTQEAFTLTFPAVMPDGDPPDADLPESTTLCVDAEVSNTSGTDEMKSDVSGACVTPIGPPGPNATMNGLRFDGLTNTPKLERTFLASNPQKFTYSVWIKPTNMKELNIFSSGTATFKFWLTQSTDKLKLVWETSDTLNSSESPLSKNTWTHVLVVADTAQAAETDRISIYADGVKMTLSGSFPPINKNLDCNNGNPVSLGELAWEPISNPSGLVFEGYQSDAYFVDGQALEPTAFGADFEGKWGPLDSSVIKTNVGDFGTNGFYLPFDSASIGADDSGKGNDFTANNFVTATSVPQDYKFSNDAGNNNGAKESGSKAAMFDGDFNTFYGNESGSPGGQYYVSWHTPNGEPMQYNEYVAVQFKSGNCKFWMDGTWITEKYPGVNNRYVKYGPGTFSNLRMSEVRTNAGFEVVAVIIDGLVLVDNSFYNTDAVTDTPMLNYAVLQNGDNGNLVATGNSNVTYVGEVGTDYYYEENSIGKVHTGGNLFASATGKTYNFGQQPFADTPSVDGRLSQTWLEWNNVAVLRADNPADVVKFNKIKEDLEAYPSDVQAFRSDLLTKVAASNLTPQEKAFVDELVEG